MLGLHDLWCSSIALLKCQKKKKKTFLCIFLKSKSLPLTLQYLNFSFWTNYIYFTEYFYITDKVDEIVPVSKPSRIADNATVDSRVATIKQRPSSRCFPSATDMNVSGSYEVLLSLPKLIGRGTLPVCKVQHTTEMNLKQCFI